jgi:hypothetical protein
MALVRMIDASGGGEDFQRAVMNEAREYVDWFHGRFETTLCRERTSTDFYKVKGQLRYLLPEAAGRCIWHLGMASSHLKTMAARLCLSAVASPEGLSPVGMISRNTCMGQIHARPS